MIRAYLDPEGQLAECLIAHFVSLITTLFSFWSLTVTIPYNSSCGHDTHQEFHLIARHALGNMTFAGSVFSTFYRGWHWVIWVEAYVIFTILALMNVFTGLRPTAVQIHPARWSIEKCVGKVCISGSEPKSIWLFCCLWCSCLLDTPNASQSHPISKLLWSIGYHWQGRLPYQWMIEGRSTGNHDLKHRDYAIVISIH